MSLLPVHRQPHSLLPDLSELLAAFPPINGIGPMFDNHLIRVEDEATDGRYVVRAEMPGIDPAKDVDITVRDGRLTIKAERTEKSDSKGRSEFSYGSFVRSISLPSGADAEDITATYDKGILTVTVKVTESPEPEKHIAVQGVN